MIVRATSVVALAAISIGAGAAASAAAPRVVNGCALSQGARCAGKNLSGQNLRGARLRNADLRGANLSRADLRHADLRNARLGRADLRGAQLNGANLQNATMVRVKAGPPTGVRLPKRDTSISPVWCGSTTLSGANMQKANLMNAKMSYGFYEFANLAGATLEGAQLNGADFQCSNWNGVKAQSFVGLSAGEWGSNCYTGYANFTNFSGTLLAGADLTNAQLQGTAAITYADCNKPLASPGSTTMGPYYPDLSKSLMKAALLAGTNLQYTYLPAASTGLIDGVVWSNTKCPNGVVQNTVCPPKP